MSDTTDAPLPAPPPAAPDEIEVKFALTDAAEAALANHPLLRSPGAAKPVGRRESTTYYDTAGGALAGLGASFRVRWAAGRHVQTLKLRDGTGPFARGEWEWTLPGPQPDPAHLAETPLGGAPGPLLPLFAVEVTRRARVIAYDGAAIELVLDRGTLRAGGREEPIREMELELKRGDPSALLRLARVLQTDLGLVLGAEAKSDRGRRLLSGRPRPVERGGAVTFPAGIVAAGAFRAIALSTLALLTANQPAAAAGVMEGVHQMRVAIRRLRALLALFRPHLDPEAEARWSEGLRALGRVLGEARDWDVFLAETLPAAAADGVPETVLAPLRDTARAEQSAAHARMREEFARPALSALVLGLAAWVEDAASPSGDAGGGALARPLAELAPDLEERLERRARRRGRRIRHRDEEALHDLRKALKKLRYGIEFLAPLHRPKRVKRYLQHCKLLQERLGGLNDAAVAESLAVRLALLDPALEGPAGALRDWAGTRREAVRARLPKGWRAFRKATLP